MTDPGVLAATSRALAHLEMRQAVSANNLANVSTPGFRGDRVFARLLEGGGGPVSIQASDRTPGSLSATGRPLDLALQGEGFLVLSTPEGRVLSRAGGLSADGSGYLVGSGGHPVLGERGPIVVPPGEVHVSRTGEVHVDGVFLDRLQIVVPSAPGVLVRDGAGLLAVPEDGGVLEPVPEPRVLQGYVEESNVNPVLAMTDMIDIQRSYATLQRSMWVLDSVLERLANDVGRLR